MAEAESLEERVLVLTPTGRDAEVTCSVLREGRIACAICGDVDDLVREASKGAGALLIADEALAKDRIETLATALERQEPWSDLPILVATTEAGSHLAHERARHHLARAGSITVLERPIATVTLLTTVRSALTARRRQYQRRDLLAELQANIEQLEKERVMRERFVAIVAHDLRGPLSSMKSSADLLACQPVSAERQHKMGRRIVRNVEQLDRMIRDLLDVYRIQAGQRLPLQLDRCNLTDLVREVVDDLHVTYGDRFLVRAEERVEGIWSADALRRAVWNLGTNAVKYGASDAPITFSVTGAQQRASLSVHNQGPAIPLEKQKGLFEPFGQTHAADWDENRGWGLGLSLVRGCAEAHGGTVELDSRPEKGTTFTIRLPRDARPFQSSSVAPESNRRDPHPDDGRRP